MESISIANVQCGSDKHKRRLDGFPELLKNDSRRLVDQSGQDMANTIPQMPDIPPKAAKGLYG
tara:strand:- start:303 stop:491 length:189 start_codon:yes stop_codon:yes gene_type:complete